MVLLLDDLVVFKAKCVEDIKCLAPFESRPRLGRNPPTIACVVTQEFSAADCGQNAVEKVEGSFASADQHAFAARGIEWSAQGRFLGSRNSRHVFRREAIEVRLHDLLSHIVVHNSSSPISGLAGLTGSADSSENFRHQALSSVR
jgi:hypothetical protein